MPATLLRYFLVLLCLAPLGVKAELQGTVGASSSYLYRGLPYTSGAAVQGGIRQVLGDWYSGAWASNCETCGGNELDMQAGWQRKFSDEMTLEAGMTIHLFPEAHELANFSRNYAEIFAGTQFRDLNLRFHFADEYRGGLSRGGNNNRDGYYLAARYTLPLHKDIEISVHGGKSWGDGVETALGSSYLDYALTLVKQLPEGYRMSVSIAGTDLRLRNGQRDEPKLVVGAQRVFSM